jgi:hypothetical protein
MSTDKAAFLFLIHIIEQNSLLAARKCCSGENRRTVLPYSLGEQIRLYLKNDQDIFDTIMCTTKHVEYIELMCRTLKKLVERGKLVTDNKYRSIESRTKSVKLSLWDAIVQYVKKYKFDCDKKVSFKY